MCGKSVYGYYDGVVRVGMHYEDGDVRYTLVKNGSDMPRQRQFRKATWKTRDGAQAAADKLNAAQPAAA